MSDYQITDEDVASVVRYLELVHPGNATEEFARKLLSATKAGIAKIGQENPGQLEELYEQALKFENNDT